MQRKKPTNQPTNKQQKKKTTDQQFLFSSETDLQQELKDNQVIDM